MFGETRILSQVFTLDYDPAADDYINLWRAPAACEIRAAYAVVANDVAASTANYFALTLVNGTTAGTATTAISSALGGTPAWTGLTPKTFSIGSGSANLAAGEWLNLYYDETGTGTFTQLTVQVDYVIGT